MTLRQCYTCKYVEHDDGTVEGNQRCDENLPATAMSCPNWANVGCYTGAAVHDVSGNDVQVEL